MPYRTFGLNEVARYLHLAGADVERLVKKQEIPCEKHGNRLVFRKMEIDNWASKRILGLEGMRLTEYYRQTSGGAQNFIAHQALLPERLRPSFIDEVLPAKTKASVLREMAALAAKTGRVCELEALLDGLIAREALCSTGVPGGLALLHPRHPDPFLFESPLIVLGRTIQQIPFGAPDGAPSDLFFLIGCPDDRLHLHILARICMMAHKTDVLAELRQASSAEEMYETVIASEQEVLSTHPGSGISS